VLMCKCNHCNFQFAPSYYDHVKIPGFLGDLREINRSRLTKLKWMEAALVCPSCGGVPSLLPEHRQWVCENPGDNYVAAGYQVSPFDAPLIIKASDLVKASTSYDRIQDFVNFNLGLPAEDNDATLTDDDLRPLFVLTEASSAVQYVMGIDVGNVYHIVIAAVDAWGDMFVVHTEQVPMGAARTRYDELRKKWRVICTVIDSMPHAETVMALQALDPNLFASVYMRSKSITTHTVVEKVKVARGGQGVRAPGQCQREQGVRRLHGVHPREPHDGAGLGGSRDDHRPPHLDEAGEGLRQRVQRDGLLVAENGRNRPLPPRLLVLLDRQQDQGCGEEPDHAARVLGILVQEPHVVTLWYIRSKQGRTVTEPAGDLRLRPWP